MNSHKFNLESHPLVKKDMNKRLLSLIDTKKYVYGKRTEKFIVTMYDEEMCLYQSRLLKKYLTTPKKYSQLVLDKLDTTSIASDNDIELVLSKKGITHLRRKYIKTVIHVEEVQMDSINKSFRGSKDAPRPYYTHKFSISPVEDLGTCCYFHVSDGIKENSTRGFRLSFNPCRFNDEQLCAVFSHLNSVLGKRRYEQIITNAMVTRIDIAIDLPGVFGAYLICFRSHGNGKESACWPLDEDSIKESTYHGFMSTDKSVSKNKASKFRVYDASLNFIKKHPELKHLFDELAVTSRIEYELIPYQSRCEVRIGELDSCPAKLSGLVVLDPLGFYRLPKRWFESLLIDKTISNVKKYLGRLKVRLRKKDHYHEMSLDSGWLATEQSRLLKRYKKMMIDPKGCQKKLGFR